MVDLAGDNVCMGLCDDLDGNLLSCEHMCGQLHFSKCTWCEETVQWLVWVALTQQAFPRVTRPLQLTVTTEAIQWHVTDHTHSPSLVRGLSSSIVPCVVVALNESMDVQGRRQ